MTKFKHKQSGQVVIKGKDGLYHSQHGGYTLQSWIFKDSNDWEEVIEKDYEILSLNYNNTIYALKKGDSYYIDESRTGGYVYIDDLNNEDIRYRATIHSVRRLSDSEIFTIGDKITRISDKITKIKSFRLEFDKYLIANFEDVIDNCIGCNINYIQKAKQPLFTTEDGVDIYFDNFKLTRIYLVTSEFIVYPQFANKPVTGYKIFSTKEAAEEYILMNKPCLSINDLISKQEKKAAMDSYDARMYIKNLKDLVKQKLNL
jgi:hypothetical protein